MRKPDVDLAALQVLVDRVYGQRQVVIARSDSGTTTQIYRLQTGAAVHYLRVAEDNTDRFGAELMVHEQLLGLGVRVPAIVHYEPFDPALNRSILITTAIPGRPFNGVHDSRASSDALCNAGRDLALVNSIPVAGFGIIDRSVPLPTNLTADFPSALAFIEHDLEVDLAALQFELSQSSCDGVRRSVRSWTSQLQRLTGRLVHGDLDGSHIYVDDAGYSGIIDFGEIRGADPLYDLGHVAIIGSASLPSVGFESLLAGYSEITPLSAEDHRLMWFWATLIGIRFLARTRGRSPVALRGHIADRIARVLREQDV